MNNPEELDKLKFDVETYKKLLEQSNKVSYELVKKNLLLEKKYDYQFLYPKE